MSSWRNRFLGAGLATALALSGLFVPAGAATPAEMTRRAPIAPRAAGAQPAYVHNGFSYVVHIQNIGWRGDIPGTTGRGLGIEAIALWVPVGSSVCVNAYVQNFGWQRERCTGKNGGAIQVGTVGQNRRIESLIISSPTNKLQAQAHMADLGWQKVKTAARGFATQVGIPGHAIESIYFTLVR